jgi:hypothetical protein
LESNTWEGQIARREARSAIKELDAFGKEKKLTDDIYQDSLFKTESDADELKEIADYLNAWAKHDAIAGRLLNGAKGTDDLALAAAAPLTAGFGRGATGLVFRNGRAAEIATARNVPFQKLIPGNPKIEAYQPTKFHKLYYKASWGLRERGSGQLNLNEADSIEEIKAAMDGMLAPEFEEKIVCNVEVRDVFKITKVGTVAGCMVTDGYIKRTNPIRLIRDGIVVYTGEMTALKRFKDDASEVRSGFDCGISIKSFNDMQIGDVIESYENREVKKIGG